MLSTSNTFNVIEKKQNLQGIDGGGGGEGPHRAAAGWQQWDGAVDILDLTEGTELQEDPGHVVGVVGVGDLVPAAVAPGRRWRHTPGQATNSGMILGRPARPNGPHGGAADRAPRRRPAGRRVRGRSGGGGESGGGTALGGAPDEIEMEMAAALAGMNAGWRIGEGFVLLVATHKVGSAFFEINKVGSANYDVHT